MYGLVRNFPQVPIEKSRNKLKIKSYFIHIDSQAILDLFPPGGLSRRDPSRFCKTGNTCYSQTHRIIKPLRGIYLGRKSGTQSGDNCT